MRLKDIKIGMTFRHSNQIEIAQVTEFERVRDKYGNLKTWIHMTTPAHDFGIKTDIACLNTYWKLVDVNGPRNVYESGVLDDRYMKGEF